MNDNLDLDLDVEIDMGTSIDTDFDKISENNTYQESNVNNNDNRGSNRNHQSRGNNRRINLWEETPKPIEPVKDELKRGSKVFNIMGYIENNKAPDEKVINNLKVVVNLLKNMGYSVRLTAENREPMKTVNEIIKDIYMDNVELYKGWKSMTEDDDAILNYPKEKAYAIANALYGKDESGNLKFPSLPATIRAVIAAQIHTFLGKKLDRPSKFVLVFGKTYFATKVAEALNIPLINIENKSDVENLIETLKNQ